MNKKLVLAAPCLAMLAACGGSSTGGSSTGTVGYSDTLGSPSEAFTNGLVLRATEETAAQINLDWTGERGERATQLEIPTFSLEKGDANNVIMKLNGRSYEFTSEHRAEINEDGTYSGLVNDNLAGDGVYVQVYSHQGTLSEFIDGSSTRKSEIVEYMEYHPDTLENGAYGVAVLGAPTNPTALGEFTTIDYEGNFRGETTSQAGFDDRRTRFSIRGDTTLIANFEQNTISGEITNLRGEQFEVDEDSFEVRMDGSILLQEGAITGSGFNGVATTDAALKSFGGIVSDDLEYSGNFYGDRGTEASGILQGILANDDGTEDNFTGSFRTLPAPN